MGAVAWSPFVADDGEQRAKKCVFALFAAFNPNPVHATFKTKARSRDHSGHGHGRFGLLG